VLKTGFIGNENFFDRSICEWLSEHTDLRLILWTNRLSWSGSRSGGRGRRVLRRFAQRARRRGPLRVADEALYFLLYRQFLQAQEVGKLKGLVEKQPRRPRRLLSEIEQIHLEDVRSPELLERIAAHGLDALFAMCIDVYLPRPLIDAPRYGSFLWHEGITPEYKGVHSPFWALANREYDKLGYTLLKMNSRLDAGEVYVQGKVRDVNPKRDWHAYIGHKAILDSLPAVGEFLGRLEKGEHRPMARPDAVSGFYSYPTGSALLRIAWDRFRDGARERAGR
jgi:formyl transferase-like protein